jgi:hypothetical protein
MKRMKLTIKKLQIIILLIKDGVIYEKEKNTSENVSWMYGNETQERTHKNCKE